MNDTPKHITQKQFEIFYEKPLKDKIAGIFELTDLSRSIILNQLRIKNPHLSEIDLKIELFKAFYKFDFDEEVLNKIANEMKKFLLMKKN
jgi:hypothetical protein